MSVPKKPNLLEEESASLIGERILRELQPHLQWDETQLPRVWAEWGQALRYFMSPSMVFEVALVNVQMYDWETRTIPGCGFSPTLSRSPAAAPSPGSWPGDRSGKLHGLLRCR